MELRHGAGADAGLSHKPLCLGTKEVRPLSTGSFAWRAKFWRTICIGFVAALQCGSLASNEAGVMRAAVKLKLCGYGPTDPGRGARGIGYGGQPRAADFGS